MFKQYGLHLEKRKMFSLFESIEFEKQAENKDGSYMLSTGIGYVAGSIISAYMDGLLFMKIKYFFKMGLNSGILKYFLTKRSYNKRILKDYSKCMNWLIYNVNPEQLNHLTNIACDLDGIDLNKKKVESEKEFPEVEQEI